MSVDLHSHSTMSDGSYSPTELARAFHAYGVKIAALTDHDTVGGVIEFIETCGLLGIHGINGIEFSTVYKGQEVHLLGYGLNLTDPKCVGFLTSHAEYLRDRCRETLGKLKRYGIDIPIDEVYRHSSGNPPMPPHILRVLADQGIMDDLAAAVNFFHEYLAFGGKAWVDHATPLEAPLNMLLETGAVAIVAHPSRLQESGWLDDILDMGAHGLELYYPDHVGQVFDELQSVALKRGCLVTGGCDYHGAFAHRQICEVPVPLEVGVKLLEAVGQEVPMQLYEEAGMK